MFYCQDILQRRNGKFGIVWIAATKGVQLTRREYCSVNVARTCEDIIEYLDLRVPPMRNGGPRPRFSLYLSSQLMYGVTKVFNKQQVYLLGDINNLNRRCALQFLTTDGIDMIPTRQIYSLGDPLAYHGMELFDDVHSFDMDVLPKAEFFRFPSNQMLCTHQNDTIGLEIDDAVATSNEQKPKKKSNKRRQNEDLDVSVNQAEKSSITMRDVTLTTMDIAIPGEQDLPPFEIGPLMDQVGVEDALFKEYELKQPEELPTDLAVEQMLTADRVRQQTATLPVDHQNELDNNALSPAEQTHMVMGEPEFPPPIQRRTAPPALPDVTPISPNRELEGRRHGNRKRLNLSMELAEVEDQPQPPARKRRRRRLIIDVDIVIPMDEIRFNLKMTDDKLRHMEWSDDVYEFNTRVSVDNLLKRPGLQGLRNSKRICRPFNQNTKTIPMSEEDQAPGEEPNHLDEPEPPVQQASNMKIPLQPDEPEQHREREESGMQSMEVAREASTIFDPSGLLDINAETPLVQPNVSNRHSRSLDCGSIDESLISGPRGSLGPDQSELTENEQIISLPPVKEIPEDYGHSSGEETKKKRPVLQNGEVESKLLRDIFSLSAKKKYVTFRMVCLMKDTSRLHAAQAFMALLNLCAQEKLRVKQKNLVSTETYSDIFIIVPEHYYG